LPRPPRFGSGTTISVYQDRVARLLHRLPSLNNVLLGYIFAHELSHVLQGTDYHSEAGIMGANWSHADNMAMLSYRLGFTESDADRIHEGIADRMLASR
jgi:hypothetical protein